MIKKISKKSKVKLFVSVAFIFSIQSCISNDVPSGSTKKMMEPTGAPINYGPLMSVDYEDYIKKTRNHIARYKVYFDESNVSDELNAASPFKMHPSPGCINNKEIERGIVLIHGLGDMPISMKDLAVEFSDRCFLVYSLLLPGHGARSSELLDVKAEDWLQAADFAVKSMEKEVDEVFVGGFSLGGLVAIKTAIDNPNIKAVFGFAPAIVIRRSFLLDQTIWIRHIFKWLDKDPQEDSWRLEAMPFNAVAETQLLSKLVQNNLDDKGLNTPIFLVQAEDDAVVDAEGNEELFSEKMKNPNSRLLSYTVNGPSQGAIKNRVIEYPSVFPELNILSYSHLSVHISPDNVRYGWEGDQINCTLDTVSVGKSSSSQCGAQSSPYRGEIFGKATERYVGINTKSVVRLTFNPQFESMLSTIDVFLDSIKE